MSQTKRGLFVLLSSPDTVHWTICKHDELPQWVLHPDTLGRLVNGEMCMKCDEGVNGSLWYRAEVKLGAQDAARLKKALAARDRREAERLLQLPADRAVAVETSHLIH